MKEKKGISEMKERFKALLLSARREGMEQVVELLEEQGFFLAPASTRFHLSCEGGLLQHSMNVYEMARELRTLMVNKDESLVKLLPEESVIIAALLHDVCKTDIYRPSRVRMVNKLGLWPEALKYEVNYSLFPMGHGEKSVIWLLHHGLKLTEDEMLAIRWHMTAWDLPFQSPEQKASLNAAKQRCPLLTLIQASDGLAAGILERKS